MAADCRIARARPRPPLMMKPVVGPISPRFFDFGLQ
jgi:hypothetical protein